MCDGRRMSFCRVARTMMLDMCIAVDLVQLGGTCKVAKIVESSINFKTTTQQS